MSDVESEGEIEDFDSASFPSDMDDTELYALDGHLGPAFMLQNMKTWLLINKNLVS
jgi:hypothetical protein